MNHIYNLKRDRRDARDFMCAEPPASIVLPPAVDLRAKMPPVYNQGQLGSCTGNGIAAVLDVLHAAAHAGQFFGPSRLFIYYEERRMEGTIADDAGASIRDGIKVVNHEGACRETTWPYDIAKFKIRPPDAAYNEAREFLAIKYERVPISLRNIKAVLAAGVPVVTGITVYDSFESPAVAATGVVPMPNTQTEQELGGHCVVIAGYDDATQRFTMRNSWGAGWGMAGYFTLPYAFIKNPTLTSDAWAIQKAE